jgi:hypothetical protein
MQSDPNLTLDQAEVQTALGAGSPVKVFLDTLNNKATSGNPTQILSAANQIQTLHDLEGGHALIGLNKQAEVIATQFNRQRGSMPDSDLARKITDNILNIDSGLQSTLDNAWNRKLSTSGAGGLSSKKTLYNFALSEVEIDKNDLGGKYFEVIYGNDIYDQLRSNFDSARGDYDVALEMTKNYVKQNFGETRANGTKQITDRPLEKVLGYTDHDVVPFIHEDALSQFNTKFIENKDPNDYWTTKPVNMKDTISSAANPFDKMYPAAEIIRHVKTAKGEKVYTYPVNFIGRPGKEWDVVVQTPSGPRNLFLVAPHLGIITYKPNERDINTKFAAHKKNKGWF